MEKCQRKRLLKRSPLARHTFPIRKATYGKLSQACSLTVRSSKQPRRCVCWMILKWVSCFIGELQSSFSAPLAPMFLLESISMFQTLAHARKYTGLLRHKRWSSLQTTMLRRVPHAQIFAAAKRLVHLLCTTMALSMDPVLR